MAKYFDPNAQIDLECPNCGHRFKKRIGDIQSKPTFPCPKGCGATIKAEKFTRGLSEAEKKLDDFSRKIGRMFK